MSDENKPAIIHMMTSILAGWNLLIFTVFLILFGLTYLTGQAPGNSPLTWIIGVVALIAGLFAGIFGGRRLHRYFSTFNQLGSYLWLLAMAYLAYRTLPF